MAYHMPLYLVCAVFLPPPSPTSSSLCPSPSTNFACSQFHSSLSLFIEVRPFLNVLLEQQSTAISIIFTTPLSITFFLSCFHHQHVHRDFAASAQCATFFRVIWISRLVLHFYLSLSVSHPLALHHIWFHGVTFYCSSQENTPRRKSCKNVECKWWRRNWMLIKIFIFQFEWFLLLDVVWVVVSFCVCCCSKRGLSLLNWSQQPN